MNKSKSCHCDTCGAERNLHRDQAIVFETGNVQARVPCDCGSYAIARPFPGWGLAAIVEALTGPLGGTASWSA